MRLIRKDLKSISAEWNTHLIAKSRNGGPSGRPNSMFYLHHLYGVDNLLKRVDLDEVEKFYPVVASDVRDFSEEFEEFAEYLMTRDGLNAPINPA